MSNRTNIVPCVSIPPEIVLECVFVVVALGLFNSWRVKTPNQTEPVTRDWPPPPLETGLPLWKVILKIDHTTTKTHTPIRAEGTSSGLAGRETGPVR